MIACPYLSQPKVGNYETPKKSVPSSQHHVAQRGLLSWCSEGTVLLCWELWAPHHPCLGPFDFVLTSPPSFLILYQSLCWFTIHVNFCVLVHYCFCLKILLDKFHGYSKKQWAQAQKTGNRCMYHAPPPNLQHVPTPLYRAYKSATPLCDAPLCELFPCVVAPVCSVRVGIMRFVFYAPLSCMGPHLHHTSLSGLVVNLFVIYLKNWVECCVHQFLI